MDYTKIVTAILSAVVTLLGLFGVITTDESSTLISTGASAAAGVTAFVLAIVSIVKAHKGKKDENKDTQA